MSIAYYNEIDPYAAQWLENLIEAGHIALGIVDRRSIQDVTPNDLRGFTQCHFFAGIGVWSHALRLAGWPDDKPVWTASCPCQPFSASGNLKGFDDERHLWPDTNRLIQAMRPEIVMGEQVASKDGLAWIDLVFDDLEGADYTVRAADTCSAGYGAPHVRQRIYWVANSDDAQCERGRLSSRMDAPDTAVGNDCSPVRQGYIGPTNGFWRDPDWLQRTDGKWQPVRSGTFPLAHGITSRVGRLRAYGNAINAQQAAAFIEAVI
jgi:DNA (cytosine-5)-methyltransferase 1